MKKYKKKTYKKRLGIKIFVFLLILGGFAFTIGYGLTYYQSVADFSFETPPDPEDFEEADEELLANVAYGLDARYPKYHLPLNQSTGTTFVNDSIHNGGKVSYTNVSYYHWSDNEALWTGIDYCGWTYKYLSALQESPLNETLRDFSKDVLINMTTGLANLMAVPNGGLGSDYGGILARGVCPPDQKDLWPSIFRNDHPKHFNGTGIYSNWRYRGYTSNDEFGGYYLFMALATKYLGDIPYINQTVGKIVDQICFNMLRNNFLGIHGTGALTGVDQKPRMFSGGFWAPLVLKMGAIYFPEKYEAEYINRVASEMSYLSNSEGGAQETIANYYAYNFGSCVCLAFLLLEDSDSKIWEIYFQGYLDTMWHFTRYHRNMWFNAIFLTICHENGITNEEIEDDFDVVALDVEDQLRRFTDSHYPNLNYLINKTLPEDYKTIKPVQDFVDKLGLGPEIQDFLGIDADEEFLNKPVTVEYYDMDGWAWSDNPYTWHEDRSERLLFEETGSSYTVPYWMMRYCGYIGAGGN